MSWISSDNIPFYFPSFYIVSKIIIEKYIITSGEIRSKQKLYL